MASEDEEGRIDPHIDRNLPEPVQEDINKGGPDAQILEHSRDADEAMEAFQGIEGQVIEVDEATNKRLHRRIDWNSVPVNATAHRHALATLSNAPFLRALRITV